jgi:hypothetical protein
MIKGILTRTELTDKSAIGRLELWNSTGDYQGKLFSCYTLEDTVRGNGDPSTVKSWKVANHTAIPYGVYRVLKTPSERFGCNMWELQNVPGFKGIRIHIGNTPADTSGCILLGLKREKDKILQSTAAIAEFETALANCEEWELEIRRGE